MLDLERYRVGTLPTLYYVPEAITAQEEQHLLTQIHASKQAWKPVSGRRLQNLGGMVLKQGLVPAPMPSWLQPLLARLAADTGAYGEGQLPNHVLINAYLPGEGIMPHEDGPLYHPVVVILSLANPAVVRFARKRSGSGAAAAVDGGAAGTAADGEQPAAGGAGGGAEAAAGAGAAAAAEGTGGQQAHPLAGDLVASVACQPRSLLIFKDEAYTDCLHGILDVEEESIDASVVNAQQAGLEVGQRLPRGGERVSLTVRRVLRTCKALGVRL